MIELDSTTCDAMQEAFVDFKNDLSFQLQVKLRRHRAEELRELLAHPKTIDIETFNREIWRLETYSEYNGRDISGVIYQGVLSDDKPIDPAFVAELDAAIDAGQIRFHGNAIWGSGAHVYGSMLKITEEEKNTHIQKALTILNDENLSLIDRANQIIDIPGFGPNIATGLLMVKSPDAFAIYNTPPKTVLAELGIESTSLEQFQESISRLREQLGAEDFFELDWFLYLIFQDIITLPTQQRFWWVNQGGSYSHESSDGYIWAPEVSRSGRSVAHHQNLKKVKFNDVILHYANGALQAVSQVEDNYTEAPRPAELSELRWEPNGYLVRTTYTELAEPIPLQNIPVQWRILEGGPFTKAGGVKQGYLFPLSSQFIERIAAKYSDQFPDFMPRGTIEQRVWVFQANPDLFDLQARLADVNETDNEEAWTVSRYESEMQAGDIAIIWQSGESAGIYAIAELTGTFTERVPEWKSNTSFERAAEMRYKQILPSPVTRYQLLRHPILQDLQILKSPQGTNFRVTQEQWEALQPLLINPQPESYVPPTFEEIQNVIAEEGLRLTQDRLRQYHLALSTSRFVILAGNSGTGKTWLAEAYAQAVNAEYIIVPVAPNWTTNEDLLGYYNPIDQTYFDTPFSRFLRRAAAESQHAQNAGAVPRPYHLILDEMNLARVEYYFARFLSAMELTTRGSEGRIELSSDDILVLPPTLHFIGTVNVDETTHSFADKIYDRAQLIQMDTPRELIAEHLADVEFAEPLLQVWDVVQDTAPFSFRVVDQITEYIAASKHHGVPWPIALDEQLLHKVLPKIKGAEQEVGNTLARLEELTRDDFPLTNEKVAEMRRRFVQHGFTSFF